MFGGKKYIYEFYSCVCFLIIFLCKNAMIGEGRARGAHKIGAALVIVDLLTFISTTLRFVPSDLFNLCSISLMRFRQWLKGASKDT